MERELLTWFEPLGSAMSQASAIIRLVPSSEFFSSVSQYCGLPWVAHMVKNLPAIQETWVRSLGQEDPLEEDDNPLHYSCLENPMDRGAWQTTVCGFAKSQT